MASSLRLTIVVIMAAFLIISANAERCDGKKPCSKSDERCINFTCLVPTRRSCAASGTCPPGEKCKSGLCEPTRARRSLYLF